MDNRASMMAATTETDSMPEQGRSKVLIVDDSKSVRRLLCSTIYKAVGTEIETAHDMWTAKQLLARDPERFYIAIVDLTLPDAQGGEIIDYIQNHGVPVVVLTGTLDDKVRDIMVAKNIIDYFVKSNTSEVEHVADLVYRVYHNRFVKVLIVDDSRSYRYYLRSLLTAHQYQVLEATDGLEAVKILEQNPDIRLVITDFYMPEMNGLELIARIRKRKSRNELAILGISEAGEARLPAKLLKTGANDFITKPILVEEFYLRVTASIDTIEQIRKIRELAIRDYLTRTYNRRYLFDAGNRLYENAKRGNLTLAAAMIDADHFKAINDNYGHHVGDLVLKGIANVLTTELRQSDIVARFGGEEFCVLATKVDTRVAEVLFERIRQHIEDMVIKFDDREVKITVSIGITLALNKSLADMVNCADEALYQAKENGRNRVVIKQVN